MSRFAWEPTGTYVEEANVTRLMRRHGITEFADLVRRSQQDVEWFWDAVVEDLGIEFFAPYSAVLDDSRGPEWPRWFTGGTINLTHNCVDRHARSQRAGKPALVWEGEDGETRSLTYADMARAVDAVAAGLEALGVERGDVVAVYMPMVPEAIVAAYGIAKRGAVYLPIFSGFGASAMVTRLNDAGAKVLLCADEALRRGKRISMLDTVEEAGRACPSVAHVVVWSRFGERVIARDERWRAWDDVFAPLDDVLEAPPLDPETPWLIAYTSGTTGNPKGSVHVHGGFLVKIAQEVAYQVDVHPDEVLYWVTDMGWIMGPFEVVGGHALGACVFLYEGAPNHPRPDRLWEMCARHRVNVLGVSPTLVRALMPAGADVVRAHDLSSLRVLGSTGEPWNPEPYRWFADVVGGGRCPIMNLSGGTEVGACFLGQAPVIPTKVCSLGTPSLGMAIDVYDADAKRVRGEVGELVCTKPWPSQTRGFWGNPGRYIDTYWSRWPGVWVHGDWASVDDDGYWFLHGRSDDTLNVAGKRIGPAEFESAAVEHPSVVECAAVGVPDAVKGTAVWLFCVLEPGVAAEDSLHDAVRKQVAVELGRAFTPAEVRFVRELPKTRSAKILRRAIRARVLGDDPGDLSSLENPGALEAIDEALA
jgi:acetyl-CoA synthetase